jgi:unsaturated rhamnogalacturonyl hydrolase
MITTMISKNNSTSFGERLSRRKFILPSGMSAAGVAAGLTAVFVIVMVAGAFAQGPATNATPTGGGASSRGPGVPRGPKLDARLDYAPGQAPKFWSVATAETIMARYPDYRSAYYSAWTYVHGYTFYAFEMISKATGDKKYMDYMKRYIDNFVDQNGRFSGATLGNLDNMMTGNSIIALYELTGDERYKKAAGQFRHALDNYPQSSDGQFYHNDRAANMWIDGIFMGQMMLTRYGKSIGDSQFCWDTATRQFTVFARHCLKGDSGLYLHAWTEVEPLPNWADPKTRTSPEVWSEGLGWYALVLVETLPMLPKDHPKYAGTLDIVKPEFDLENAHYGSLEAIRGVDFA